MNFGSGKIDRVDTCEDEDVDKKKNVYLLDIICFEYILLEFTELIEWIYAPDDEFLRKRARTIAARHTNL